MTPHRPPMPEPVRLLGLALVALLSPSAAPALGQDDPAADPAAAAAQEPGVPFARLPDVSPDGRRVAFTYQGDVFTAPIAGGTAERLTVHEAYESRPRFSPDGEWIAFESDRHGNDDLFVMASDGSDIRRLTWHSTDDAVGGWTPDGRILFGTERTWQQVEREDEVYSVAAAGGTPDRLLDAVGYDPRPSPDGRFLAFEFGSNGTFREGYRGPANRDLWIHDTADGSFHALTEDFDGNDFGAVWVGERTLLFVSERGDAGDLYRLSLDADGEAQGQPERLTALGEDGIRAFGASDDGSVVVLERGPALHVLEPSAVGEGPAGPEDLRPLEVRIPADDRFYAVERRTYRDDAEEYALSPDGQRIAFVVRGELFLTSSAPDEERTVRLTSHSWRDREPAWVDDSTLVFSSDRDGDYDLYRLVSADPDERDPLLALDFRVERLTNDPAPERSPVVAPDGERVAFVRGPGALVVADLAEEGLTDERVLREGWADPGYVAWSPDSRWLAYALDDLDFNQEIYIQPADGSREPVNVSQHPRPDDDPVWSPDGSKLGFLSNRNNGDDDVWFVWLREEDWEKTRADWELQQLRKRLKKDPPQEDGGGGGSENGQEAGEGDAEDAPPEVEIDFDRIHERLRQVTSLPGNESDLRFSPSGDTLFFVTNRDSRQSFDAEQDLWRAKWDGTDLTALTSGGADPEDVRLGPEGEWLYARFPEGRLGRVAVSDGEREGLPFAARVRIDHPAERRQAFSEAWRLLRQNFYDPDFHGQDWDALRAHYEPWAMKTSTKRGFADVFNMMLGELNASHLGFYAADRAETEEQRTGLLGAEIDPVEDGVRVERVVPKSPADREESRLRPGDVITAVDGEPVSPERNFYSLLVDRAGERTVLSVRDAEGSERRVVIRPTESLSDELYEEWVRDRAALVEEYSGGRLGYIHVRGMNWPSFERFERELEASGDGKEGLLVDVRYNGGGWTTDYLLTVLTYPQHAYTVPRGAAEDLDTQHTEFRAHYPFGERLPQSAWTKPVAALANENSFSNAEIFSHAFKTLGLGPLVGGPTFGAVISTGGAGLIDGSFVRLPFRGWYVRATDENMENGPAVPDISIPRRPDDRADGEDAQLRGAVDALLVETDGEPGG